MKFIIISDSHGHIANLRHVMGFAKKIKVDGIIHCGDWDDVEAVNTVLEYDIPLYSILGNADVDHQIEEVLKFNAKKFDDNFLQFEIEGRKIGVIHNARSLENNPQNIDIVFSGHYHSQEERMLNFVKFVRPGALINGINFAIYETVTNTIEFISDKGI